MRALTIIAPVLGSAIAVFGVAGIAAPSALLDAGRPLQAAPALYVVAAVRVVFGAVLAAVAPAPRVPRTLRVLASSSSLPAC